MRSRDVFSGLQPSGGAFSQAGQALLDLVWPTTCGGCDDWGPAWCESCGRVTVVSPSCVRPSLAPAMRVHTATEYAGPLARAITAFKDHGRSDLAPVLAAYLRVALAHAVADEAGPGPLTWSERSPLCIVPVPSSPSATRSRGRFAWGEVVREAVRSTAGFERRDVLVSGRSTLDQARLGRAERAKNMSGAIRVSARRPRHVDSVRGRDVVVVDDVVTTGASLGAAVLALAPLRPRSIACATIAAAR